MVILDTQFPTLMVHRFSVVSFDLRISSQKGGFHPRIYKTSDQHIETYRDQENCKEVVNI